MKRVLLLLGVCILVFTGCAADKKTMVTVGVTGDVTVDVTVDELSSLSIKKATILQNAAIVLRAEKFEREADLADKLSMRILEILRRGEDDVYLASWPGSLLSGYAERLRKMGREEAALKLEEYSNAYDEEFAENLKRHMQEKYQRDN